MRPQSKATWLLTAVASGFVSIVAAAEVAVTGWNTDDDPFSSDPAAASNSIAASAVLDFRLGVRANLKATCEKGQIHFAVSITNGSIEPTSGAYSEINIRLDKYGPDKRDVFLTGNSNRVSFLSYQSRYLAAGDYFLIGIPMNGTRETLRISLKESRVAAFLSQCTAAQEAIEKKAAEEQAAAEAKRQAEEQARRAAEEARIQAERARSQRIQAQAMAACIPGRAMRVKYEVLIYSFAQYYDDRRPRLPDPVDLMGVPHPRAPEGITVSSGRVVQVVSPNELNPKDAKVLAEHLAGFCVVKTGTTVGAVHAQALSPASSSDEQRALEQQPTGSVVSPQVDSPTGCFVRMGADCVVPSLRPAESQAPEQCPPERRGLLGLCWN